MRTYVACLALVAALSSSSVRAQYLLGGGDVLEVSVFGVPDFKRRVTVDVDGDVSIPFLGEVHAAGRRVAELRASLAEALVKSKTLRDPDVTLEIAEYRPFYVSGDVARPGAVPYRPGATVRHAVALAGGYDALRFKAENPVLMASDLRGQYAAAWADLARRQARVLSLRAQVEGRDTVDLSSLQKAPLPSELVAQVSDLEAKELKLRLGAYARQRDFLKTTVAKDEDEASRLKSAIALQRDAINRQTTATDRMSDAQGRGVVPAFRVDEDRRSLAGMQAQLADQSSRATQNARESAEDRRKLEAYPEEERMRLLSELRDTVVDVEKLRASVEATNEKLVYTGALRSQLKGQSGGPDVVIHRKVDGRLIALSATEDDDVRPDDVIDVTIRPERLVVGASR